MDAATRGSAVPQAMIGFENATFYDRNHRHRGTADLLSAAKRMNYPINSVLFAFAVCAPVSASTLTPSYLWTSC